MQAFVPITYARESTIFSFFTETRFKLKNESQDLL